MSLEQFDVKKNKVRCMHCNKCNNEESYCTVKKTKISLNKKRRCEQYEFNESKVKPKKEIPSQKVPSWNLKSNLRKQEVEKLERLKAELARQEQMQQAQQSNHPLTGDLSKFKTTGTSKDE